LNALLDNSDMQVQAPGEIFHICCIKKEVTETGKLNKLAY